MNDLNREQKELFADLFNERYIKNRGFGSMNKNDIEVMLFDIYRQIFDKEGQRSNYQWSTDLRIPETKIRRLAYEANLVYHPDNTKELIQQFFGILSNNITKFSTDKKKIQFVIENKSLRTMLSADLKSLGYFADTSFNSEIVSVELEAFGALLMKYYPEGFKEEMLKECRNKLQLDKDSTLDYTKIMQVFLEGLANGTGEIIPHIIKDIAVAYNSPVAFIHDKIVPCAKDMIKKGINIIKN